MKYRISKKVISVHIGNVIHKDKNFIFDTDGKFKNLKSEVEAAFNSGFLEKVEGKQEKEPEKQEKVEGKQEKKDKG